MTALSQAEITEAYIEYLESRVAELEVAREWRDIATAPKDGTMIDVHMPGVGRVTDVFWAWTLWHRDGDDLPDLKPTHWMPLPQPPTEDAPR